MEGGETEKLQQNGEASNLALGKVDAGEGELMLSPAQAPPVKILCCLHITIGYHYYLLFEMGYCISLYLTVCVFASGFARTPSDQMVQRDPAPGPVAATG